MDPLDAPPAGDHGTDRYDYVEVTGPDGVDPPAWWVDLLLAGGACGDCRVNLFFEWTGPAGGDPADGANWHATVAHDETCPTWRRMQGAT